MSPILESVGGLESRSRSNVASERTEGESGSGGVGGSGGGSGSEGKKGIDSYTLILNQSTTSTNTTSATTSHSTTGTITTTAGEKNVPGSINEKNVSGYAESKERSSPDQFPSKNVRRRSGETRNSFSKGVGQGGILGVDKLGYVSGNNTRPGSVDCTGVDPAPVVVDSSVGLSLLPVYMRGGIISQGLGNLLGNALALLFVARHGLKESELWAMLATLRARPPEYLAALQIQHTQDEKDSKMLERLFESRGLIEDNWRTNDPTHTGMISLSQLQKGLLKCNENRIKKSDLIIVKSDLMRLLQLTDMMSQSTIDAGYVTGVTDEKNEKNYDEKNEDKVEKSGDKGGEKGSESTVRVDYRELIRRIVEVQRVTQIKHRSSGQTARGKPGRTGQNSNQNLNQNDDFNMSINNNNNNDYDNNELSYSPNNSYGQTNVHNQTGSQGQSQGQGQGQGLGSGTGLGGGSNEENPLGVGDDSATLGPVVEESLLELLTSLGALHSPEHQVVLLPSENHQFRELIKEQFVEGLGLGLGEDAWHGHMIRFVRTPIFFSYFFSTSFSYYLM